jgi:hypothetical protein
MDHAILLSVDASFSGLILPWHDQLAARALTINPSNVLARLETIAASMGSSFAINPNMSTFS